eukprot:8445213-Lingulodinium_polyedra.AAC.1
MAVAQVLRVVLKARGAQRGLMARSVWPTARSGADARVLCGVWRRSAGLPWSPEQGLGRSE